MTQEIVQAANEAAKEAVMADREAEILGKMPVEY